MTTREERNEKFILDEYRAAGVEPVRMEDGRLVSVTLARQQRLIADAREARKDAAE